MNLPDFDFYRKADYLEDLIQRIDATTSGDRVALAAMSFEVVPLIRKLAASLQSAARRGVQVNLAVDANNFMRGDQQFAGPLLLHSALPQKLHGEFADKASLLDELRNAGINVAVTNQPHRPFTNPYAGRSHIKLGVINDRVYLGGCNLDEPTHLDIMVGWHDAQCADQLYEFVQQMVAHQGTSFMKGQDRSISASRPNTTIFIDAGKPRQSLILEQALKLIDESRQTLLITSQFFPNDPVIKHVKAARRRGVKVTIMFSHPSRFNKFDQPMLYLYLALSRMRLPADYFAGQIPLDKPYLHTKLIATESAVMFGSHNYNRLGVNFGTAEIALLVRDPQFTQALRNFVVHEVVGVSAKG